MFTIFAPYNINSYSSLWTILFSAGFVMLESFPNPQHPTISDLHLTPSCCWLSHSSSVFVPLTSSGLPLNINISWDNGSASGPANLQLNVILLNPIWKLNIEKNIGVFSSSWYTPPHIRCVGFSTLLTFVKIVFSSCSLLFVICLLLWSNDWPARRDYSSLTLHSPTECVWVSYTCVCPSVCVCVGVYTYCL